MHCHSLTLGAHAQRGLRSVCLSVYAYSRSTGYEAAYERYQQLEGYESMKIKKGDFPETTAFQRYGVKTSEKANIRAVCDRSRTRPAG